MAKAESGAAGSDIDLSASAPLARKQRLRRLGLIFGFGALILAFYGIYWLLAARHLGAEYGKFVHAQGKAGVEISQEYLHVSGFPYRLTLVVGRPDIRFDTGWRWRGERAVIHISPLDFSRASLDLSRGTHVVTTRTGEEWRIDARRMLGRSVVKSGRLVDLGLKAENLRAIHRNGQMRFDIVLAFSAITPASPDIVRLALRLKGGDVDPGLHRHDFLGARLENAEAALELGGGASADLLQSLFSPLRLRNWAAAGGELQLKESRLDWGPALISGKGALQLDVLRRPQGSLRLEVNRVGDLAEALIAAQMVSPGAGEALRLAASLAALNGGRAPLPFRLRDGDMALGPVKIFAISPLP